MRVVRWGKSGRRGGPWLIFAVPFGSLALLAAGYGIGRVNSTDWRTSDDAARAILQSPQASPDDRRRALFVIGRHERENSAVVKKAAEEPGYVGDHARNALTAIREDWR